MQKSTKQLRQSHSSYDENATTQGGRGRLRVIVGAAIGPGKARLLEALEACGSISAAARELEMSYRRAWLLVDSMNRHFREDVVQASKGGRGGGGARLTAFGREALGLYHELEEKARASVEQDLRHFETLLK